MGTVCGQMTFTDGCFETLDRISSNAVEGFPIATVMEGASLHDGGAMRVPHVSHYLSDNMGDLGAFKYSFKGVIYGVLEFI